MDLVISLEFDKIGSTVSAAPTTTTGRNPAHTRKTGPNSLTQTSWPSLVNSTQFHNQQMSLIRDEFNDF